MAEQKGFFRYWPLCTLIGIALLASIMLVLQAKNGFMGFMHFFMGFFFCQFAMLKLFHPGNFADGFQQYDLLAKRFRIYGYFYPLIELILGLSYLSFCCPLSTYAVTVVVMGFSALGVIKALRSGLDLRCACMGTVLDVPLSTVTLTEDIAMGIMAGLMLFSSLLQT